MINIAVLGYGTVGSGVVEVINKNHSSINKRAGEEINIKYVLDLRDFPGDPVTEILVHDYNVILKDDEVEIVVEVMGGINPALQFTRDALLAGKSVCTSNKELVAAHGAELLAIAKEKGVNFLFEASVGGGIPIIRPLNQSLTADEITEITGILNGTTNYILTKMTEDGSDFETVLKSAQEMGYAERNPEADVEGYDACRKIAILASLAYGKQVDYEDIYTEGITAVTKQDIAYSQKLKTSIKLLGTSKVIDGKLYALVAPFMIGEEHPLKNVNGVFNGIYVDGNMLGGTMFYGKGAGKLPTASAVVSDVIDAAKHKGTNIMTIWDTQKVTLGDISDYKCNYFVRISIHGTDEDVVKAVREAFPDAVILESADIEEFAFMTGVVSGREFDKKIADFHVISRIRVTDDVNLSK
ncbi:MAG: homoserine dehydrogenase [Clostridium sp.]|nr:homoserine dehydrogenase [Clostridium sp.]MCM1399146.1 homoserine dehydrogenase [Clostridium sp.]MCM1459538.1 homoserine dehydrogenase [Bacteroides sp.]